MTRIEDKPQGGTCVSKCVVTPCNAAQMAPTKQCLAPEPIPRVPPPPPPALVATYQRLRHQGAEGQVGQEEVGGGGQRGAQKRQRGGGARGQRRAQRLRGVRSQPACANACGLMRLPTSMYGLQRARCMSVTHPPMSQQDLVKFSRPAPPELICLCTHHST